MTNDNSFVKALEAALLKQEESLWLLPFPFVKDKDDHRRRRRATGLSSQAGHPESDPCGCEGEAE